MEKIAMKQAALDTLLKMLEHEDPWVALEAARTILTAR